MTSAVRSGGGVLIIVECGVGVGVGASNEGTMPVLGSAVGSTKGGGVDSAAVSTSPNTETEYRLRAPRMMSPTMPMKGATIGPRPDPERLGVCGDGAGAWGRVVCGCRGVTRRPPSRRAAA
jgi:hypothetical protein